MESIFIQIASYRDPELIPTIDDLLANASNPDALTICIAHQHSEEDQWDTLQKYADDGRFIIIDIPHTESLGACWARNQIQQHYDGQKYTLQLDSHHRFIKGWDTECIKMLKDLQKKGHKKPLLTSYISSYNPENDPEERQQTPWGMSFDKFTPEGVVFFLPYHMGNDYTEPIKARFYSAHFAFTVGDFCKEVPHDPMLYFHGEEITIAVRAYTHGYDLFHPHKIIAWHEYTRKGRTKHWDDDVTWGEKNNRAHDRTRMLLGIDGSVCSPCNKKSFEGYNIGEIRSISDYEVYAGLRFRDRAITESCGKNLPPPGNNQNVFLPVFRYPLAVDVSQFHKNDYTFCALICADENQQELYRKDYSDWNTLIKQKDLVLQIEANVKKPHLLILWAHSKKDGWSEKIVKNI
jgi:ribosomal protein S6E (S10)